MRSADLDPIDAAFDDVKRFSRHEPLGFRVRPPPHGFGRGNDRPSNSTTDAPLDARSRAAVLPAGPAPQPRLEDASSEAVPVAPGTTNADRQSARRHLGSLARRHRSLLSRTGVDDDQAWTPASPTILSSDRAVRRM